jgi:hypothetical protein
VAAAARRYDDGGFSGSTLVSRDNLDENGSDNQSLKWRPVAKS